VIDAGTASATAGDMVVIFGPGFGGEPTVADWASWAGTIPHEILTRIGPRVTRRYLAEGDIYAR
jgi:alanine racemase